MRPLIFLVLVFFMAACTARSERTIYFQATSVSSWSYAASDVTEDEAAQLVVIAERMNDFIGRPGFITFTAVDALEKRVRIVQVNGGDIGGAYNYGTREIEVIVAGVDICMDETPGATPTRAECFEAIMLHELGHSLGMRHVEHDGVMHAPLRTFTGFTDADRAECESAPVCRDAMAD